jgi:hypothetical protein
MPSLLAARAGGAEDLAQRPNREEIGARGPWLSAFGKPRARALTARAGCISCILQMIEDTSAGAGLPRAHG